MMVFLALSTNGLCHATLLGFLSNNCWSSSLVKGGLQEGPVCANVDRCLELEEDMGTGVDGIGGGFTALTQVIVRAVPEMNNSGFNSTDSCRQNVKIS